MATNDAVNLNQLKKSVFTMKNYVDTNKPRKISEEIIFSATAEQVQAGMQYATDNPDKVSWENCFFEMDINHTFPEVEAVYLEYQGNEFFSHFYASDSNMIKFFTFSSIDDDYDDTWIMPEGELLCYMYVGKDINKQDNPNKCLVRLWTPTTNITDFTLKTKNKAVIDNELFDDDVKFNNSISMNRAKNTNIGPYSIALGEHAEAPYHWSIALGNDVHARGQAAASIGQQNISQGTASVTMGWGNRALANYSYAQGRSNLASAAYANASGYKTKATSSYAKSSGVSTTASGSASTAEGNGSVASGANSHAEGYYTIAKGQNQHAEGKFNIEDTANTYAHIVGNGSSNTARSNAHTLDWNGNGWYAGKLSQEGTPTEDKDLTNKKYVDDKVAEANASGGYTHPDSHPASMITGLATVATSGSYNDLNDKPIIPDVSDKANISGQVFTGAIEAPTVIASTYFRTPALVGEGDNSAYYHRVNFGYRNHDYWEFHEYGGDYRFYENKNGTAAGGTMIANIKSTYSDFKGEVRENGTRVYSPNNKPTADDLGITIPSIDGLATETYVNNKVADLIDSAPEALNTLNELATALGNDANFATTISNQIGLKVNSADLATVATSGSYNDLSDKPTIPAAYTHPASHPASMITGLHTIATSGDYNDLNNKPSIPTVTNDLTNELKANYDAAYTHSTSVHAPSNAQKNSDITKSEIEAKLTGNITTHTHSQYLTSIPSEYITEQELTSKGYATATTNEEVKTTVNRILGGAYIE